MTRFKCVLPHTGQAFTQQIFSSLMKEPWGYVAVGILAPLAEEVVRDIHFIWLAGYEKPDFITINRFRNRLIYKPSFSQRLSGWL